MSAEKEAARLAAEEREARRQYVLNVVGSLYLDFNAMGLLKEAGPHLQELMSLALYTCPDATAKVAAASP